MPDLPQHRPQHPSDPTPTPTPAPASATKRRSRSATNYRIVYFAVHHDADPPDPSVTMGMLRGPDGDKPLIVGARSPEMALEDDEVRRGLRAAADTIGKVVAIPDSAWHE